MHNHEPEAMRGTTATEPTDADRALACNVWLEEYRALEEEIDKYQTSLRLMITLQMAVLGSIGGVVIANVTEYWRLLLMVPLSSFIVGCLTHFYVEGVFTMARYTHTRIKPALHRITGEAGVIGWNEFVDAERRSKTGLQQFFTMPGLMFMTFSVPSIGALVFAASHLDWQAESKAWVALLLIGSVLAILQMIGFIMLRRLVSTPFVDPSRTPS